MDLIQIKGHKNLVRDLETGAILNTDSDTAIARKRLREQKKNEREQLEKNTNDINSMKEEVTEIKDMVKQILGSLSNGR